MESVPKQNWNFVHIYLSVRASIKLRCLLISLRKIERVSCQCCANGKSQANNLISSTHEYAQILNLIEYASEFAVNSLCNSTYYLKLINWKTQKVQRKNKSSTFRRICTEHSNCWYVGIACRILWTELNSTELSVRSAARDLLCCRKDSILMNAGVCAFSHRSRRCRTLITLRRRWWWWWCVLLLLHMPLSHHRNDAATICLFSLFLHSNVPLSL